MRKHFLRFLAVMLLVCCGALVFTACDKKNPDGPETTTYTLTYLANGGEGDKIVENHAEGESVTLKPADTFTRADYTFTKWKDGETEYDAGASFTMPARNVTLSAQWQQNAPSGGGDGGGGSTVVPTKYTVSLNVTGGGRYQ